MVQLRKLVHMTVAVGVMTTVSLVFSYLALVDINRSIEPDLSMEWAMVRISFFLIVLFMGLSIATIWLYGKQKPKFRNSENKMEMY